MNAIIVSAFLGVVMMFASWSVKGESKQKNIALFGLIFLILANLAQLNGWYVVDVATKNMLSFTRFGLYTNTLFYCLTFIYIWINGEEVSKIGNHAADFYALFFFILCGASILTSFDNLLMLFIGIEILSIPLYFLMGSFSTGILLLGITFIYGATGSFNIIPPDPTIINEQFMFSAGLILIFAAMNFKVSAAPFHFWTPDVYDGAPTVFTSFMATIAKSAGFIAFINIYLVQYKPFEKTWGIILPLVIVSTLMVGNVTAVFQRSVKRMLTYSSIAQAGFMLFALYGTSNFANEGILLYIVVYSLASIGIFAVLVKMKENSFEAFHGLAKSHPFLAFLTTVFLCSLAGIPITGGFFAKYYMINAVLIAGAGIWLVVVAMIFASISVYYYFKLIQAMYFIPGTPAIGELDKTYTYKLAVIAILIVLLGVFPNLLFNYLYF
jgi:NADH-quinone oxidoreductase subunit N